MATISLIQLLKVRWLKVCFSHSLHPLRTLKVGWEENRGTIILQNYYRSRISQCRINLDTQPGR